MSPRIAWISLLVVGVFGSLADAQGIPSTVQLPTFSFFSVSTTVSVPDRGGAFLGGVSRGRWGSTSHGVPGLSGAPGLSRAFRNRGIGSSVGSSGASVTATIVDHSELDEAVLAVAARRGGAAAVTETDRKGLTLSRHVARAGSDSLTLGPVGSGASVAEIRRHNQAADRQHQAEILSLVERGRQAEAAGKLGAASCCYNIVARRGTGKLREYAAARLAAIQSQQQQRDAAKD